MLRHRNPRRLIVIRFDDQSPTPEILVSGEPAAGDVRDFWINQLAFDPRLGMFRLADGAEIPRGYKVKIVNSV